MSNNENHKGLLIVLSGPSGAGKGVIYNSVIERMPNIKKSISVTTRAPRPHEIDGIHYHFINIDQYRKMIANNEFLETASVYRNFYGTPKEPVFKMLENGDDVMFEIDVFGTKQIKAKYPDCIAIFVMTPSFKVLEQRLRGRNTETEDSILTRLGNAKHELKEYKTYDYFVINDDIDDAIEDVISIIRAEKRRINRNEELINKMLEEKR